ncbi:aminotransferase class V-fold PLP-dependent enzyme [archaeon]|nr:MAG: aminotransferase class V-fold PLP-dependent enzyme [archaeon]
MTPPKNDADDASAKAARVELLLRLAKALKHQGAYHLATKKYTQAGAKVKAMKALLRSGDTEKIIFFAGMARSVDAYILAANYLTTQEWHAKADIMKSIVEFYSKAKAWEQLANFFTTAAGFEIDEYRNYDKALAALKEALKQAARIVTDIREARVAALTGRIAIIERFLQAKRLMKSDVKAAVDECLALLDSHDAEAALRVRPRCTHSRLLSCVVARATLHVRALPCAPALVSAADWRRVRAPHLRVHGA